jgi:hypothetical protein
MLEDVQLTGVLRPTLERAGLRFAPIELARRFSIEHASPAIHHGWNALGLFGHHAKVRRLCNLSPLTLRSEIPLSRIDRVYVSATSSRHSSGSATKIEFVPEPAQ